MLHRIPKSILFALALMPLTSAMGAPLPVARQHRLVVGWHDEFNKLDAWSPWTAFGGFDILRGDVGKLTVVLGKTSMYMAVFKHYRAGVYCDFYVDLDHFPVLAVRVLQIRHASEWDAQVFQYREPGAPDARDVSKGGGVPIPGNPQHLVADTICDSQGHNSAGLVLLTVVPKPGDVGKKHVRLLLNLSGPQLQGYVDFAWVRFIRREDADRLRAHPNLQSVELAE